jgi:uncharacterized membrane protein
VREYGNFIARVFGVMFALYPFCVAGALQVFSPRMVCLVVGVLFAIRLLYCRKKPSAWLPLGDKIAVGGLVLALMGVILDSRVSAQMYPVMVNGVLLVTFYSSVLNPPTVIERMARAREPDLPVSAIPYIERVTLVWSAFFLINGVVALLTVLVWQEWWLLYNGMLSYVLAGTLFAVEWGVRQFVMRSQRV